MQLLSTASSFKRHLARLIQSYPNIAFGVAWASASTKPFELLMKHKDKVKVGVIGTHHVRNGAEDVSISLSIIFNTDQTMAWRSALNFNQRARKVGVTPARVGQSPVRDAAKARLWSVWSRLRHY